jgi:hypothetical protein
MLQEATPSASGRRGGDPPLFSLKALVPLGMRLTQTRETKTRSRNLKSKSITKNSLSKLNSQSLEVVDGFRALVYYLPWFPPNPWSLTWRQNPIVLPDEVPARYHR